MSDFLKCNEPLKPLVTVGIPAYNRPEGLERTLRSICGQTYSNLEIIISDNASPDRNVEHVAREFMKRDARVIYHRQSDNVGSMANFSLLVTKGSGDFFMWAADDDCWKESFVENCVTELMASSNLVMCQMEAQYELSPGVPFPFFYEGSAFRHLSSAEPRERVRHLLGNVYGNLVYGVFRRDALLHNGRPVTEWIGRTMNEIPMELIVASRGGIRVLAEVGMYKSAPKSVYQQARWEQVGGWLPNWSGWMGHLRACRSLRQYHRAVMHEVSLAIRDLNCDRSDTRNLLSWAKVYLLRHEFFLALRWKPRSAQCELSFVRMEGNRN